MKRNGGDDGVSRLDPFVFDHWLRDTHVICQPSKRHGEARVVAWLEEEKDRCYTNAIVIAQLAYWVRTKEGRQRQALQSWLTRLVDAMHGRVFGFNVSVVHVWAEQEHELEKAGKRMPVEDSYIAATARRYGLTIATGNEEDFPRLGFHTRRAPERDRLALFGQLRHHRA